MLCQPILSRDSVEQAHILLIEFCKHFESLYGTEHCTPNMHMSLHLKECLLNFGPLPAFWCFAFERFNGILERISKSWVSPEKQMFLKFLEVQRVLSISKRIGNANDLVGFIFDNINTNVDIGSLSLHQFDDNTQLQNIPYTSCCVDQIKAEKLPHPKLTPPYKEKYLNSEDFSHLKVMYSMLYPSKTLEVSRFYKEYRNIVINSVQVTSKISRSQRSSVIAARWPSAIGIDSSGESPLRIGLVNSFIENEVTITHSDGSSISSVTHNLMVWKPSNARFY